MFLFINPANGAPGVHTGHAPGMSLCPVTVLVGSQVSDRCPWATCFLLFLFRSYFIDHIEWYILLQAQSGMTPMMTPSYTGGTTPSQPSATPSYQPTPRSQWPGATPKTPQSTAGSKAGSSAGMDWAKAAELWAKQRRTKPGTPRSGMSPGVRPSPRPSPRHPDESPVGGDSTPLIDER